MQIKPGASLTVYAIRIVDKNEHAWNWPIESFHLNRKDAEVHMQTNLVSRSQKRFNISRMHLIYRKGGWFRINALPINHPTLDAFAQAIYAPDERHPALFNPYTGLPRDPADIQSDPFGMRISTPDAAEATQEDLEATAVKIIEDQARHIATTLDPATRLRHLAIMFTQDPEVIRRVITHHNAEGYIGKVGFGIRIAAQMISHLPTTTCLEQS